ncbi:unnamed protein product [Pieris macdunnoughi]|uniref:FLYWCH-type domain-containing protein n=1 Tax=Pieris macdunnoughi TaxID=345717 RepID=A0A821Q7Q2_9NEOP|nr:unnamed protein product [Pieris macdunnoughi]
MNYRSKSTVSWLCSSRNSKKCPGSLILTHRGDVISYNSTHTHKAPIVYKNKQGKFVKMRPVLIKSAKKKYALLYKSYTFTRCTKSKKGVVWKCSSNKTDNCKCVLTTDANLAIVQTKGEHNHKKSEVGPKPKHVYFGFNDVNE